jgi:RHS repeat-associated protein
VYATHGTTYYPPLLQGTGAGNFTDRNGNQVTVNSSGLFTDTLGQTALTVAGIAPTSTTFTYTAPSGAPAPYTMSYTTYTVKTNFGCSGVAEYGPTSNSLVDRITLPDGTFYQFNYEATPGFAGDVTGRLASVTLPTGGTIAYTYAGGSSGHITCSDGSASGYTRQTPDGTWTYARTMGSGAASTTTITDPQGNVTVSNFSGIYPTQSRIYQGSTSGTLLKTVLICYNNNYSNCPTAPITLPITFRDLYIYYPNLANPSDRETAYNAYGLVTMDKQIDFVPSSGGSPFLSMTQISYANLGNGIVSMPSSVQVFNNSGTVVSQTNYNYDETAVTTTSGTPQHVAVSGSRGNLTSINYPVGGLTSHFTYYDTGTMNTSTDVNGAVTTFNYSSASCGNSFPTSINEPLNMTRSMAWNCTGGALTQLTDENGKTTATTYNDPHFWRPASATDPTNATVNFTYNGQTSAEASLNFNSGNSTADSLATVDSLGRIHVQQARQAPGSANFDSVEQDYDTLGRPSRATLPYAGTAGQTNSSAPSTTTTFDALGRPTLVSDAGGGFVAYSYSQNDVFVTIGPNPSGENTKRRQLEYDALGRLTSVCEITSASGSGTCGQTSAQTGLWTKYSYDALNNLTGVTQNAQAAAGSQQTRSYSYDGLSRLTSETNPESGTTPTTYTYDSYPQGTCGGWTSEPGDLMLINNPNGTFACYVHDALHRVTDVATTNGCKRFRYDNTSGVLGSIPSGVTVNNVKGRLAEAETDSCAWPVTQSSIITDEWFSYTARGETSDVYESTLHSGGYYHVGEAYWANGVPNSLTSNISGLPTFTYGVDGEGRTYQVSASSGQNPVTNTAFNSASLPTAVTYGSGDGDSFSYDSNTNRMTQYKFTVNSSSFIGALAWNANGTLQTQNITDPFNSADTQNCSYQYDDLTRLTSANCGNAAAQTFTYDPFGNITKSGSPYSFQPTYSSATNRMTNIAGFTPTYDNNGNVLSDSLHTYTWNADGRPLTIDSVGITYDALGRPVEQNQSGSYRSITYAPTGEKLALVVGQGTVQWGYIHLTGGGTAVYSNGALGWYRHPDLLGSSRLTSTPSRTFFGSGAYAPFGESYAQAGATDASFTGMNQDAVAGLYDFPAREYSIQGRWPSPDPAGLAAVDPGNPQSWNRYAYVLNNPLNFIDPLGLDCVDVVNPNSSISTTCTVNGGGGGGGTVGPGQCAVIFDDDIPIGNTCDGTGRGDNTRGSSTARGGGRGGRLGGGGQKRESFAQCVKNDANFFSLQHGLQAISGGRLGSGFLSSALLGSSVSAGIDFVQSFGKNDPGTALRVAAGEALSNEAGPAAVAAASNVPNVAFAVAGTAGFSVNTATVSVSARFTGAASGIIPTGTLARLGAAALNGALKAVSQIKDPLDLSVATFSAVVCSIGR